MRVCLVTEELAGAGISGGIGAAIDELADALARAGAEVDVLLCPTSALSTDEVKIATATLERRGITLLFLDPSKWVWGDGAPEKRSYAVFCFLKMRASYNVIHFHDYKGLGFFSLSAKKQGMAFRDTQMVVQLHGPTRWTMDVNKYLPTHVDQLRIDHLEKESIAMADVAVSPSRYLLNWLDENGFKLPPTKVIKNVCSSVAARRRAMDEHDFVEAFDEIIFFARHEDRKGFSIFCDALDRLSDRLASGNVKVTFLGKLGEVGGHHSGIVLAERAKQWDFSLSILPHLDRNAANVYLARRRASALVVVPSPIENSPYVVIETIELGCSIITSRAGGAGELVSEEFRDAVLCEITAHDLSNRIERALNEGHPAPKAAEPRNEVEAQWINFHRALDNSGSNYAEIPGTRPTPRVVLGITHFERPAKLLDALRSAMAQTYENLEIVILDDGSKSEATIAALESIETIVKRSGGKLIRQENKYLGAARNAIAGATQSDYLVFLDDDDILFPTAVERLVQSALATDADVVNCLNLFMDVGRRHEAWPNPAIFNEKVSYVPTAGPLSLTPLENCLGAATALIKRGAFSAIGGYSEIHGVGHEDYELFTRMLQDGMRLIVRPEPLYLYEVNRPSMISQTSVTRNFLRVVDAIDFSRNPKAWRDIIALNTGRTAREIKENRRTWESRNDPNRELTADIEEGGPLLNTLFSLRDYAAAIGSPIAANAFAVAAHEVSTTASERSKHPSAPIRSRLRRTVDSSLSESLNVRLDLEKGDADSGVSRLTRLAKRGYLKDEEWGILPMLPIGGVDRRKLLDLLNATLALELVDKQHALALPGICFLALLCEDSDAVRQVIETALVHDEVHYRQLYLDVAAAIDEKRESDALTHYRHHGKAEGRYGFPILTAISNHINAAMQTNFEVWEIALNKDVIRLDTKQTVRRIR